MDLSERFWSKVDAGGSCWEWRGARARNGYGRVQVEGKNAYAHRVAWLLSRGSEAPGLVCHRCDNRACVRPDHLFVGTYLDNMRDCVEKGRTDKRTGDRNQCAKLDDASVIAIRTAAANGESQASIGRRFGLTQQGVSLVVSGKRWSHVARAA
jgi:hypothetical protein